MKEIENYEELIFLSGGRRGLTDDLVCALLSAGLAMISFGLGAVAAIGCWVIAEEIHF